LDFDFSGFDMQTVPGRGSMAEIVQMGKNKKHDRG